VFDAIAVHAYAENGCLSPLDLSPWAQAVIRVVGGEKARLTEAKQEMDKARARSKRAMTAHKAAANG